MEVTVEEVIVEEVTVEERTDCYNPQLTCLEVVRTEQIQHLSRKRGEGINWQEIWGHNSQPSQLLSHVKLDHLQTKWKAANSPHFLVTSYSSSALLRSFQLTCVLQDMGKA